MAEKVAAQNHLDVQKSTLDDLDELGEIMTEMLLRQQTVEVSVSRLVIWSIDDCDSRSTATNI
jgi:hypothetical protein